MSVSILEALQNADLNLQGQHPFQHMIAKEQLHNAVSLLEKGYPLSQQVEPLMEKHGSLDAVPDAS